MDRVKTIGICAMLCVAAMLVMPSAGPQKIEASQTSAWNVEMQNETPSSWTDDSKGPSLISWTIDANNYVEVDTSRNVVAVVGGSSVTLPTAIPSWSVSDVLDLRVDVGNGAPRGSASINDGAATSLGTGAGSHSAIAASGGIDLLCSSTSSQWEGWIQVMQALAA